MALGVAAREIADLIFELIDRQSGFDGLIMNNGLIRMMFMDVFGGMSYVRCNGFALNNRLDRLMNVVVGFVMDVGSTLHLLSFGRGNLLLIRKSMVLLMMTTGIFFRHLGLVMTVFGLEILVLVLGRHRLLVRDRLDSVLVVVNIMFTSDILVEFLGFLRTNGLVSDTILHFRSDGGVMVFSWGKNLYVSLSYNKTQ